MLVAVGEPARAYMEPGVAEMHWIRDAAGFGAVAGLVRPGDAVLVKASRAVGLEGIPAAMLTRTLPFKILQMRGVTLVLYEEFNNWRQIFTDGRPLPNDPQPAWLGYSVGSWDGETFVVKSEGFNDKSWLDAGGSPHTEALRTTERLRRTDFGHMEITFTFEDPRTFTKPWSVTTKFNLLPDTDLLEHHCDNEKWLGKTRP